MHTATINIILVATALVACKSAEEPTRLPLPAGAIDVKEVQLFDGHAHQTYFKMKVRFPANLVLEHYSNVIKSPWVRCDWSPEWQRFVDATVTPNKTVHQQMYMWINRPAQRTLMLANRYYSSESCSGNPENDDQQVILLEHMNEDINDTIASLKLRCPESERVGRNERSKLRRMFFCRSAGYGAPSPPTRWHGRGGLRRMSGGHRLMGFAALHPSYAGCGTA